MQDGSWASVFEEAWELDSDFYPARKFPDARPRHGRDEIAAFYAGFSDAWQSFEFVPLRVVAIGDDRVFVHGKLKTEGGQAHLQVEGDLYQSIWLRHGRFLRWEDHLTEAGALHGLGVVSIESS